MGEKEGVDCFVLCLGVTCPPYPSHTLHIIIDPLHRRANTVDADQTHAGGGVTCSCCCREAAVAASLSARPACPAIVAAAMARASATTSLQESRDGAERMGAKGGESGWGVHSWLGCAWRGQVRADASSCGTCASTGGARRWWACEGRGSHTVKDGLGNRHRPQNSKTLKQFNHINPESTIHQQSCLTPTHLSNPSLAAMSRALLAPVAPHTSLRVHGGDRVGRVEGEGMCVKGVAEGEGGLSWHDMARHRSEEGGARHCTLVHQHARGWDAGVCAQLSYCVVQCDHAPMDRSLCLGIIAPSP